MKGKGKGSGGREMKRREETGRDAGKGEEGQERGGIERMDGNRE